MTNYIYSIDVPVNKIYKLFKDLDELEKFVKNNDCLLGTRDYYNEDFAFKHWLFGGVVIPTYDPFQQPTADYYFVVTPNPEHVRFIFYPYMNLPAEELQNRSEGVYCWITESYKASIVRKSDVMSMRNQYAIKLYLLISTLEYDKIYSSLTSDLMVFLGAMVYDVEGKDVVNADDVEDEKDFLENIFPKAVDYLNNFRNPKTNKQLGFTLFYSYKGFNVCFCIKIRGSESPFPKTELPEKKKRGRKPKSISENLEITQEEIEKEKLRLKRRKSKREIYELAVEQLKDEGILVKETPREYIPKNVKDFVWTRDGGKCVRCGSQENLVFDHIIPVAQGGASIAENLQILCRKCNSEKRDHIGEL